MGIILKEHLGFLHPIFVLAKNEIKVMFKGSVLGFLWALIKPAFTLFIFWFVFEFGLRTDESIEGISKFDFMLVGFIPWFFIRDSLTQSVKCLRKNAQYITKMNFPISTIMTFTNLSFLLIHLMLLLLMLFVLLFEGNTFSLYNIQIFYYLPLMFIFFVVISWITSILNVFFKDVQNIISTFINGLFWISGIVWDIKNIDVLWLKNLLIYNPINYFINGYRETFLYHQWFWENQEMFVIFWIQFIIVSIVGSHIYIKNKNKIADFI